MILKLHGGNNKKEFLQELKKFKKATWLPTVEVKNDNLVETGKFMKRK